MLASLNSLLVACTHSTAVDGSEDAPEPDLPAAGECADGVLEPGELCLVEHETPMPATILHVGDFDGDGNPDIATHGSSDGVSLWEGDGACGFSFRGAVSIPQTENQGIDGPIPMLATLDDDGLTDLVTVTINEGPGRVQAYVNDGDWGFVAQTESTMLGAGEPWSAAFAGDLDGDGLDEVLVEPVNTSGTLHILDYAAGQFEASGELVASADECWSTNWTKVPSYHNYTHGFVFTPGRCFDADHSELTLILVEQGGDMVSTDDELRRTVSRLYAPRRRRCECPDRRGRVRWGPDR
ncbi:MAG: VCBS repeat-containing protein [Enhygromyxa sp.]